MASQVALRQISNEIANFPISDMVDRLENAGLYAQIQQLFINVRVINQTKEQCDVFKLLCTTMIEEIWNRKENNSNVIKFNYTVPVQVPVELPEIPVTKQKFAVPPLQKVTQQTTKTIESKSTDRKRLAPAAGNAENVKPKMKIRATERIRGKQQPKSAREIMAHFNSTQFNTQRLYSTRTDLRRSTMASPKASVRHSLTQRQRASSKESKGSRGSRGNSRERNIRLSEPELERATYSFSKSQRFLKSTVTSPGPAHYRLQQSESTPKITFSRGKKQIYQQDKGEIPGPADYNPRRNFVTKFRV